MGAGILSANNNEAAREIVENELGFVMSVFSLSAKSHGRVNHRVVLAGACCSVHSRAFSEAWGTV